MFRISDYIFCTLGDGIECRHVKNRVKIGFFFLLWSFIISVKMGSCVDNMISNYCSIIRITVTGYDYTLPEGDIKNALIKVFSSCGEIIHFYAPITSRFVASSSSSNSPSSYSKFVFFPFLTDML